MKKIVAILVTIMLIFSGCSGSNSPDQTQTNDNTSTAVETENQENTTNETEITTETQGDDIRDEDALKAYFYELYKVMADSDNIQDEGFVSSNLSFTYSDYNFDDQEDVICYSQAPSATFSELAVITVIDGAFTTVPNEIEPLFVYSQEFKHRMNSDFLIRTYTGGGTGISNTATQIYHMASDRIYDTKVSLITEGYVAMPSANMEYSGEIFDMSYKVTSMDEEWLLFQYDYRETDVDKNEVTYSKTENYEFNAESHTYTVSTLEESAAPGTGGEAVPNNEGVYLIDELTPGQIIGSYSVVQAYNNVGNDAGFLLECAPIEVMGTLSYDNVMWDEFNFTPDQALISTPIRLTIDGINYDFDGSNSATLNDFDVDAILTDSQKKMVKEDGTTLKVKVSLKGFGFGIAYYSEGGGSVDLITMEVVADSDVTSSLSDTASGDPMADLHNETFYTTNQGEFVVNYPSYKLVVIPMFDSINESLTTKKTVDYEGAYINQLKFTVFGEMEDVKIVNIIDMADTGEAEYLGTVKNTTVVVNANLPSDLSVVKITGQYKKDDGTYVEVSFTIDDMRSLEEYQILTFE